MQNKFARMSEQTPQNNNIETQNLMVPELKLLYLKK